MTKGVNHEIPLIFQLFIWEIIERIYVRKDCLKIFKLIPKRNKMVIIEFD